MNYPLISEYIEAIRNAEDNFDKLSHLRPVYDSDGDPIMNSGNYAVVFKMTDGTKDYAIKCFTREQEGRENAYKLIMKRLRTVSSSYLCNFSFYPKELYVDTTQNKEREYSIVMMDWVEGISLDAYIRKINDDKDRLNDLLGEFCRLADWLLQQDFAHGDLKPDNIIIQNDKSLVLVDYDGMFVPDMTGEKARELGSPNYRHPQRDNRIFDASIDDFSLVILALSIKALSLTSELLLANDSNDYLILKETDLRDISNSEAIRRLQSLLFDTDFRLLYGLFVLCYSNEHLTLYSHIFKQIYNSIELSKTTNIQLSNTQIIVDENYVEYSDDYKYLLGMGWYGFSYEGDTYEEQYRLEVNTYSVNSKTQIICDEALCGQEIENIILPESLCRIGTNTFVGCSQLKHLTIPDNVRFIGDGAFRNCTSLSDVYSRNFHFRDGILYDIKRQRVISGSISSRDSDCILPNTVNTISDYAFKGTDIKSISIPESVKHIGKEAFRYCNQLESLSFPKGVHHISEGILYGCQKLSKVRLPSSIKTLGNRAFCGCENLDSITIPDGVITISEECFAYCKSIKDIYIPKSVKVIEKEAFHDCKSLRKIVFPVSIEVIMEEAFSGCAALEEIVFTNSNVIIASKAFNYCKRLRSVVIDTSLATIHVDAFYQCDSLPYINGVQYVGDILIKASNDDTTTFKIKPNTKGIASHAFENCRQLFDINLPKSLTNIGAYAFRNTSLFRIDIPDSVERISELAFSNCDILLDIHLPNNISTINRNVFADCKSLRDIRIPNSVIKIESRAFAWCHNLSQIELSSHLSYIGECAFDGCKSLSNIMIPNDVTTIEKGAFRGCEKLKNIALPDTITKLNIDTFENCTSLSSVILPNKLIELSGFNGCTSLRSINIPDSVKVVGFRAFKGCTSLKEVHLPDTIIKIETSCFENCTNLYTISIPNTVKEIGTTAFGGCCKLKSVSIPFSVSSIDNYAFRRCESLEIVYLNNPYCKISDNVFDECKLLKKIYVPIDTEDAIIQRIENLLNLKDNLGIDSNKTRLTSQQILVEKYDYCSK